MIPRLTMVDIRTVPLTSFVLGALLSCVPDAKPRVEDGSGLEGAAGAGGEKTDIGGTGGASAATGGTGAAATGGVGTGGEGTGGGDGTGASGTGGGGVCTPDDKQCSNLVPQVCDADGQWQSGAECPAVCEVGECVDSCTDGNKQCTAGGILQRCEGGVYVGDETCEYVCSGGACGGECIPGEEMCGEEGPQRCDLEGQWQDGGEGCGWLRQFGKQGEESIANDVSVDTSGNVYVSGFWTYVAGSVARREAFVRKYDSGGNEIWTQHFGRDSDDHDSYSVVVAPSDDIYVVGNAYGSLPGQTSAGEVDGYVRKYDPEGGEIWTRQFGSATTDFGYVAGVDASSNVYVGGTTFGTMSGQSSAGGQDGYVRKYDPDGGVLWTRQFGSSATDHVYGLSVDSSGNAYLVGHTLGTLPGQSSAGGTDAYVRKYDSDGGVLWTRQFGTNLNDRAWGVDTDSSGNVYVSGRTIGTFPSQTNSGGTDAFVRKYDSDGEVLWTRQFGSAADDESWSVAVAASGDVYVTGWTTGSLPGHTTWGGQDLFVRKYDSDGDVVWTRQLGSANDDYLGWGVDLDVSGRLYVTGYTYGTLPGQTPSGAHTDGFVWQLLP